MNFGAVMKAIGNGVQKAGKYASDAENTAKMKIFQAIADNRVKNGKPLELSKLNTNIDRGFTIGKGALGVGAAGSLLYNSDTMDTMKEIDKILKSNIPEKDKQNFVYQYLLTTEGFSPEETQANTKYFMDLYNKGGSIW